jgi:hypothetical protein
LHSWAARSGTPSFAAARRPPGPTPPRTTTSRRDISACATLRRSPRGRALRRRILIGQRLRPTAAGRTIGTLSTIS